MSVINKTVFKVLLQLRTRTLFGIQILDHKDEIEITLPHMDKVLPYIKRDEWLKGIRLKNQTLTFTVPAPEGTNLGYDLGSRDFADVKTRVRTFDIVGQKEVELEAGAANIILKTYRLSAPMSPKNMVSCPQPAKGLSNSERSLISLVSAVIKCHTW